MTPRGALSVVCLTFVSMLAAAGAAAQETREDQVRQQRAEKAAALHADPPGTIERGLLVIEDRLLMERLFNPPRGVFVRWGGLPEGAGLGGGPAVRFSNHAVSLTGTSVITARRYWEVDARLALPRLAGGLAFAEVGGRGRDFPQEDFYGLGPDSSSSARTSYALRDASVDALGGVRPAPWLSVAGGVEYLSPRIGSGRDSRGPSIEALFTDAGAPGLQRQPDFLRTGAVVRVDYLDEPFGTGLGGRYAVAYDRYADRDGGRYSFARWDVDVQQFVPIVHSARLLALHARFVDLSAEPGREIPFYLLPTLGGGYSLRGLPAYRLRDRSLVLLQAEYRWQANPFVTGALFYDAGTVAPRRRDLDLGDLRRDYGVGVRLGWMSNAAVRADLAFGDDGPRLVVKFSNVF